MKGQNSLWKGIAIAAIWGSVAYVGFGSINVIGWVGLGIITITIIEA